MSQMERLDQLQITVASARDQMEHCTCTCGCSYAIHSRVSLDVKLCFGCRTNVHMGGQPLLTEEDRP